MREVPRLRVTPVPSVPTLSGRMLWGKLLSNDLTWLEWTQTDRPRVLKLSASIESADESSRFCQVWWGGLARIESPGALAGHSV